MSLKPWIVQRNKIVSAEEAVRLFHFADSAATGGFA